MKNLTVEIWDTLKSKSHDGTKVAYGYNRACPICTSLNHRVIHEFNDFQFYCDSDEVSKRYDVRNVQCFNCFAVFMDPCYSETGFKVLFDEAGKSYGSLSYHTEEQIAWLEERALIEAKTKILDVGCYDGSFLAQLPNNLMKYGVDIDQGAIALGKLKHQQSNMTLVCEDFTSVDLDGVMPDCITMYHVLEHLSEPVRVLERLRKISHSNTKIIIEVPVIDNGNTNDIHGFFTVQHATHFSKASLSNCLRVAGWEITEEYRVVDYNGLRVMARPISSDKSENPIVSLSSDWLDITDSLVSWYKAIYCVEERIQAIPKNTDILIWGGGMHIEYLYQKTSFFHDRKELRFVIVDSDTNKQGKTWRGINIISPDLLDEENLKKMPIVISSYGSQSDIVKNLQKRGVSAEKIFKLYDAIRRY